MDYPEFETIADFSKRINLPDNMVRGMVKQGLLPCLPSGKRNYYICVVEAIKVLREQACKTAKEIGMTMPVPIKTLSPVPIKTLSDEAIVLPAFKRTSNKKGRIPDKVKARLEQEKAV